MKGPSKFWVQYGNKLTLLVIVFVVALGFYLFRTLGEPNGRHNALKIAGGLEYVFQKELLLGNVHAVIDPDEKSSIVVSGTVTNREDLARVKKVVDDWTVESVPMKVIVTVVGDEP